MLPELSEDFVGIAEGDSGIPFDLSEGYEVEEEASKTWKLNLGCGQVRGIVDGKEAVRQAVYCILNTERYESLIYSWDYGVELEELFGEPVSYVLPELKRRITEALTQDERIADVRDFTFDIEKHGVVRAAFTVETVFGEIPVEKTNY
ncbi:MAG: DUF2634 domain-containing protein [Eubacterium sp.]|nr:DUF2634 domain-containing protein [Eubacterium sp.]